MTSPPTWASLVALAVVLAATAYCIVQLNGMLKASKDEDAEDVEDRKPRYLRSAAYFQFAVALVLGLMGAWINVVALVGMGLLMMFSAKLTERGLLG